MPQHNTESTVSAWVKSKQKLTASLEKRECTPQEKYMLWNYGKVERQYTTSLLIKKAKKHQ